MAAHHEQPWRFSNRTDAGEEAGRFDLDGDRGTCYFAATLVGAILERVVDPEGDDQPLVSIDTLRKMRVWSGDVLLTDALADVTVASVRELNGETQQPCAAVFGEKWLRAVDDQPAVLPPKAATAYELDLPDGSPTPQASWCRPADDHGREQWGTFMARAPARCVPADGDGGRGGGSPTRQRWR